MKKAWVITVDMGYGHQRAAYALKDLAFERIITANSDKIVTKQEKKIWKKMQFMYEGLSRMRSFPIIGKSLWHMYDHLQSISPYYPYRDLSKPNFGSVYTHRMIRKNFLKSIIEYTKKKKLPFISTFFAPALAAAKEGIKNVYCVVTDSDINRVWAPEEPKKDKIFYLCPSAHSAKRLAAYGVPEENIFFTGFPLPRENCGSKLEVAKTDLARRLPNLDPQNRFIKTYKEILKKMLGKYYTAKSNHTLTLTYAVGGAGAQKDIGKKILLSLKRKIHENKINVNLVAGTRPRVAEYYRDLLHELGLEDQLGKNIDILIELNKPDYFKSFSEMLHETDILWTKPSELSFYTALGIPIIIAPPLGSHEVFNQDWLMRMGSGIRQENPKYVNEWLFEWLNSGRLAEAAWAGFTEAPRFGTYNIEKVIFSKGKKKFRY